ncbi:MAG: O-antigen ligase family protein [Clostridia bacterium]|nr:O-antigen ligase family protein [Clostridia bacterium]
MRWIKYIRVWDWLLVLGSVLAPMTSLRFRGKIGPAELFMIIWALRVIDYRCIKITYLEKFFIAFLTALLFGSLCGLLIAPRELSRTGWVTWVYMAIISHALSTYLRKNARAYNLRLFGLICILTTLVQFGLYHYSLNVSRSFLGAKLWYSNGRYSGGGTNPHQVALVLCGVTFWHVYKVIRDKNLLYAPLAYISIFLMNKTQSSTGQAAIYLSFAVLFVVFVITLQQSRARKLMIIMIAAVAATGLILVYRSEIYQRIYEWVSEDSNGLDRFNLWSSFSDDVLKRSPIFGLGAGPHAGISRGFKMEFHNSYIEVFAATGAVGFTVFLIFICRIISRLRASDPLLIPIVVALFGYSVAGYAMRRLVFWILIVFVIVLADQLAERSPLEIESERLEM